MTPPGMNAAVPRVARCRSATRSSLAGRSEPTGNTHRGQLARRHSHRPVATRLPRACGHALIYPQGRRQVLRAHVHRWTMRAAACAAAIAPRKPVRQTKNTA
jgi:hypothetical protein